MWNYPFTLHVRLNADCKIWCQHFPGLFTLNLSLVMSMSLLVAIPAMLAHWAYYHFHWASTAHLHYFYLLLCLWAYWLSFLSCWTIGLITSFHFLSLSSFPIVEVLLLLGLFSKKNGPQHFLIYIFRTHHGTKIEIENIALKILDVVYTNYWVYINECERIIIVIITTIY